MLAVLAVASIKMLDGICCVTVAEVPTSARVVIVLTPMATDPATSSPPPLAPDTDFTSNLCSKLEDTGRMPACSVI